MDEYLYESHLAFDFARHWGRIESLSGYAKSDYADLLGNAQNPFDAVFGDLVGQAGVRYFIIEFKSSRKGFGREVKGSAKKIHRSRLYEHLRNDQSCRELGRRGHFAAYSEPSLGIAIEPYAHAPAEYQYDAWFGKVLQSTHEMDYGQKPMSVAQFFEEVVTKPTTLSAINPYIFESGVGLTESGFYEYVACMYVHLEGFDLQEMSGTSAVIAIDEKSKVTRCLSASLEVIVAQLMPYIERHKDNESTADSNKNSPGF